MENITLVLSGSYTQIVNNPKISIHSQIFSMPNNDLVAITKAKSGPNELFYDLFIGTDSFERSWSGDNNGHISGRIKIMKLEHVLQGLKQMDPNIEEDEELYNFYPIDLIADEANCGVFINDGKIEDRMFFHSLGEMDAYDLKLSFYNYLRLADACHGYFYWPKYILSLIGGNSTPESESFEKNMPEIFPNFSLDEFNALFEELRLK